MLEMDQILRPSGHVYIRDSLAVMDELQELGKAMGWHLALRDTSEGSHASYYQNLLPQFPLVKK